MVKIACLIFVTLCSSQTVEHSIDDELIRRANRVSLSYVKPNLKHDKYIDMRERAVLLNLDVLLAEVVDKKHTSIRAKKIIELSNQYVAMNNYRSDKIKSLLKELKEINDKY